MWSGQPAFLDRVSPQTGRWWPIMRPTRERWLDLTLVLDNGPSMALWRSRVAAFVEMLERLGAFRTIQIRLLDFTRPGGEPVLHGGTPGTPARDSGEVLDSSGRRAVLVLTDGVSTAWRQGALLPTLAAWGRRMPVSVVRLLPQHLWARRGMTLHTARLSVPAALKPNSRWALDLPDAWLEPDPSALRGPATVPVPVIELQPRRRCGRVQPITARHQGQVGATVPLTDDIAATQHPPAKRQSMTGMVHRFRSLASPPALRLATLLAALPVHLDVAQLVQRRFVPESGVETLTEILLSGLVYSPQPEDDESTWDTRAFIIPQAGCELLNGARRSATNVVRVAAAHFGERIPMLGHLRHAIADPHNTLDPILTRENVADVDLEGVVCTHCQGRTCLVSTGSNMSLSTGASSTPLLNQSIVRLVHKNCERQYARYVPACRPPERVSGHRDPQLCGARLRSRPTRRGRPRATAGHPVPVPDRYFGGVPRSAGG